MNDVILVTKYLENKIDNLDTSPDQSLLETINYIFSTDVSNLLYDLDKLQTKFNEKIEEKKDNLGDAEVSNGFDDTHRQAARGKSL